MSRSMLWFHEKEWQQKSVYVMGSWSAWFGTNSQCKYFFFKSITKIFLFLPPVKTWQEERKIVWPISKILFKNFKCTTDSKYEILNIYRLWTFLVWIWFAMTWSAVSTSATSSVLLLPNTQHTMSLTLTSTGSGSILSPTLTSWTRGCVVTTTAPNSFGKLWLEMRDNKNCF